jgi:hypothetical protein
VDGNGWSGVLVVWGGAKDVVLQATVGSAGKSMRRDQCSRGSRAGAIEGVGTSRSFETGCAGLGTRLVVKASSREVEDGMMLLGVEGKDAAQVRAGHLLRGLPPSGQFPSLAVGLTGLNAVGSRYNLTINLHQLSLKLCPRFFQPASVVEFGCEAITGA